MSGDEESPQDDTTATFASGENEGTLSSERRDPLIGRLIDNKYEIQNRLGGGGMGVVYTARHALMNRTVAIKVLHPHLASGQDDEFFKRFLREAQTSSKLSHPNCITIFDFGIDGEYPFLVMELKQGRSLKQLLKEHAPLSIQRTVNLLSQVCAGMEEAHHLGIVHRDIKPDNIIVTERGNGEEQAVVLDFGIAKIIGGSTEATSMTQTGGIIGTPQYMAPEQVLGKELDARCDVYALGVVLYEMLSGEVPFEADSAMALMMKHLNQEPISIRKLNSELQIPKAVDKVLEKVLKKDPSERYESVRDFRRALEEACSDTPRIEKTQRFLIPKPALVGGATVAFTALLAFLFTGVDFSSTPSAAPTVEQVELNQKLETPADISVELKRAEELFLLGDFQRTILLLQAAVEKQQDAVAHSLLGRSYQHIGKSEQAVVHLNKALDLQPNQPETRYALAILYASEEKVAESVAQLQRAVALQPLLKFNARAEKAFQRQEFKQVL